MYNWKTKIRNRLLHLYKIRSLGDLLLFGQIFLFAAIIPRLSRFGVPKMERLVTPSRVAPTADPIKTQKIIDLTDAVLRFGKPLVEKRCFPRGLTLYYFLRKAGLEIDLHFGVEKKEGQIYGHCWLVKNNEPFSELKDPRTLYRTIYSFPSNSTS